MVSSENDNGDEWSDVELSQLCVAQGFSASHALVPMPTIYT